MARGRKRKQNVKRYPSGKINTWEDPRMIVDIQRHKQEVLRRRDPKYGYPLGILHVERKITDAQFEAGRAYAALAWRYSQIKGFQLPMPRAINWEGSQGSLLRSEPYAEEVETLSRKMEETDAAIEAVDLLGRQLAMQVLINDQFPANIERLRVVLTALVNWREPKKGKAA